MEENPRSVCGLIGPPRHAIIPRPSPDGYEKLKTWVFVFIADLRHIDPRLGRNPGSVAKAALLDLDPGNQFNEIALAVDACFLKHVLKMSFHGSLRKTEHLGHRLDASDLHYRINDSDFACRKLVELR